ncbi:hypothetical protein [Bdellovibrio sp. HCB209]|uniref:hypothetical protein n=1 Tax=Bdellovibrio sp. HCB209 TaxID=3394354 RepID=UPI0039B49BC0
MFRRDRSIYHKSVLGFSALEMIVAAGILATIFIVAMPFFSQQGKIIKGMRTSASCQAVLDTAFSRIGSLGTSLQSHQPRYNQTFGSPIGGSSALNLRAYQIPAVEGIDWDPAYAAQRQKMYDYAAGALYTKNPGKSIKIPQSNGGTKDVPIQFDGVTLYTPLLLKGSMEYLATKYGNGYCKDFQAASLLSDLDKDAISTQFQGGLKDVSLAMKVNRYNLISGNQNNSCDKFWPRPRNGGRTSVTYEPQFGYSAQTRQIIGMFPSWIGDSEGFRVTLRADFTNEKGQKETCEGTKDFSLPEDKQNVVDYFYDVNFVKTSPAVPGSIVDNTSLANGLRQGTTCQGNSSCLGHPFETILTNLQPYNASNPNWPENRDRPLCSQTAANKLNLVISFRVYNMHKENGVVPMCMDTSYQWFKQTSGNWCPGAYNGGAETSFDKSWDTRYTGWVPCEHMRFCNSVPDRVTVTQGNGTNFKLGGSGTLQPYTEYKYFYDQISGDKNNPRMWGCEVKFGVTMLDAAGNLAYTPAQEAMMDKAGIDGDRRPPIKEINAHVYFKPPPCYTCNCKPCKGGKGLFGGLFNWVLFAVLVVVSFGAAVWISITLAVVLSTSVGVLCYNGGLGCASDGGKNFAPDSSGGKYRSCDDSNNGCKCGKKCNVIKPPSPGWSGPLDESMDTSQLEKNSCVPGSTFYIDGVAHGSIGNSGLKPQLGYKVSKGPGKGYEYMMDQNQKVTPGDEIMYSVFDSKNARFCYVAARCAGGKFQAIKESSEVPGDNTLYPLAGCYPVKVGKRIAFNSGAPGISQGGDACLEVQFNTGPQNPSNFQLWKWANYNEQCGVTTSTGALSTDPRVVAGSCPTSSGTVLPGAQYSDSHSGCSNATTDPNDMVGLNFACKNTKIYWDPCYSTNSKSGNMSCPKWCYADCTVPDYIPEHPWLDAPNNSQRYYEDMGSGDSGLKFCTMDRTAFDEIK